MTRILQQNLKLFAKNAKSDTFTHFWTFQVEKRICLFFFSERKGVIHDVPKRWKP